MQQLALLCPFSFRRSIVEICTNTVFIYEPPPPTLHLEVGDFSIDDVK